MPSDITAGMMAKYVIDVFQIKADNPMIIEDVVDELKTIEDLSDFRAWLKDNFNHYDSQYLRGFQKFISLIKIYRMEYALTSETEKSVKLRKFAQLLSSKVKAVSMLVLNEPGIDCVNLRNKDDQGPYFTKFEERIIGKIGGLYTAVMIQRSVSGADPLQDKILELSIDIAKNRLALATKQKKESGNTKPLQMVKNAVKRF